MTDRPRVVLITGAAGGIGRALTARFAAPGTALVLLDRDGDALVELVGGLGGVDDVLAEATDVTDADAVDRVVIEVEKRWGAVDVLLNNAAYAYDDDLLATEPERWDEQIGIALRSVYLCSRAVLPGMQRAGGGVVVSMSSVNAGQFLGNEAYSAAKAGVESLTRSIAVRHGSDGIRAVALGIGTVLTPGAWEARIARDPDLVERLTRWYPAGRLGRPEDVAALAHFVASDEASWITGTTIMVDGGLTAGNRLLADDVLG